MPCSRPAWPWPAVGVATTRTGTSTGTEPKRHFQILGKTRGKDAAADKATYPALIGLEAARDMARGLVDEALDNIATLDGAADPLRQLAGYIIDRRR